MLRLCYNIFNNPASMRYFVLFFYLSFTLAACAPSPERQSALTAAAMTITAAAWTPTSTITNPPTETSTPSPTQTQTTPPSATPKPTTASTRNPEPSRTPALAATAV